MHHDAHLKVNRCWPSAITPALSAHVGRAAERGEAGLDPVQRGCSAPGTRDKNGTGLNLSLVFPTTIEPA